jgi:catechol 2,3-dioxygenase-like lactoylglutathione lyase family enzyme
MSPAPTECFRRLGGCARCYAVPAGQCYPLRPAQNRRPSTRIDHFVLTVRDIELTCDFYRNGLGMEVVEFGQRRKALAFGRQKINLHQAGREIEPKAKAPTPGAGDFCAISALPLDEVHRHLEANGITLEAGPVPRTGATGPITSLYLRDPGE